MASSPQPVRTAKARLARQTTIFAVMLGIAVGGCRAGLLIADHVKESDSAMGVLIWTGIAEIVLGLVGFVGLLVTAIQAIFELRAHPPATPPPPQAGADQP